jgi:hypothetical protein
MTYEMYCKSTDVITGIGFSSQVSTAISTWMIAETCMLGGGGDSDTPRVGYNFNNGCGADVTFAIGDTTGTGCEYAEYKL